MTVEVPTPTPLQRLSEIVEAGTPGEWRITGDAGHPANIRLTAIQRRHIAKVYAESPARDLECEANAALIVSAVHLARFLCSPEAVEVLARVIHPGAFTAHVFSGDQDWHPDDQKLQELKAARIATACLNTIAEQALKESK